MIYFLTEAVRREYHYFISLSPAQLSGKEIAPAKLWNSGLRHKNDTVLTFILAQAVMIYLVAP